ncbi:uncharacterized protein (UPF0548 family) [Amycolatopsis bartoniae]|uniref:DUF1990 domain-containing protein n=1 Tax=Amycolatopsis bartoniae TaxID=941986 RepID=A0A8H9IRV7_9PSEU|nr:DUF1990 family protein [Amycolatopsis bartoniae]MBB2938024.1 uncharacterized protein (UPF0548 family) [Amycolatopsis bartoniae]TVT06124.1 DUF1990 family protein [Amycolatopsis bartoniae]GHF42418.1 hypothetical protein GCM10017566_15010 [Amycolatopsis bartoniae]
MSWVFGRLDAARVWRELAGAEVNYSVAEVRRPEWNIDTHRHGLPAERPGPPEPGGSWEHACRLVRGYEFSPPETVRALFDPDAPLLGRDMLLEARFHGLHFYCGVRVTEIVDETRDDGDRVWGWAYETLEGHLERGKVTYQVIKHQDSGRVEFVAESYSQGAPTLGPVVSFGWRVFGRQQQLRFYRRCGARLREFTEAALRGEPVPSRPAPRVGRLVVAPSDAKVTRWDAVAVHRAGPG